MSKIFDAAAKNGVIDLSDLASLDGDGDVRSETLIPEPVSRLETPVRSTVPKGNRTLRLRASALSPVFPFEEQQQRAAEQYRVIRTKILHDAKKRQVILVSSATSGDGKTVTAINIAASLALKSDSDTLLVDADLRFPRIAEELDLPASPGLTDLLAGKTDLDSALIRCQQFPQLYVIAAGTPVANPSELLDSVHWHQFLDQARSRFTTVVLDAPPMATVADHELVELTADGVIFVVRPDHSERAAVLKGLTTIPKQKLLGVVLNCVEDWCLWKAPGAGYYQDRKNRAE